MLQYMMWFYAPYSRDCTLKLIIFACCVWIKSIELVLFIGAQYLTTVTFVLRHFLNPFLSVHIPYVQSEGILPQIRLLQWRAYIFRNTQCFSTKLGRNMVNALFCHKTLKYWWPLTYIQGHVIQDGCQIQSEKSILGQKIAITRPIFWQIWSFLFCYVVKY